MARFFLLLAGACLSSAEDAGPASAPSRRLPVLPSKWSYRPQDRCKKRGKTFANVCGPHDWSKLNPVCGEVGTQSPIDAPLSKAEKSPHKVTDLKVSSPVPSWRNGLGKCNKAEFHVNAHTNQVLIARTCPDSFALSWLGKEFKMLQYHWHSPSEHTLDGKFYDVEAHHVFVAKDGQILVIGVFMNAKKGLEEECNAPGTYSAECARAEFFKKVQSNMPEALSRRLGSDEAIDDYGNPVLPSIKFNPDPITQFIPPMESHFYTYMGSLTTPDCSDGVVWILNPTPVTIFESSLTDYRDGIADFPEPANQLHQGSNNRPIQPLGDRKFYIVGEVPAGVLPPAPSAPAAVADAGSVDDDEDDDDEDDTPAATPAPTTTQYDPNADLYGFHTMAAIPFGSSGFYLRAFSVLAIVSCLLVSCILLAKGRKLSNTQRAMGSQQARDITGIDGDHGVCFEMDA